MSCNVQILEWAPHSEDETVKPSTLDKNKGWRGRYFLCLKQRLKEEIKVDKSKRLKRDQKCCWRDQKVRWLSDKGKEFVKNKKIER